MGDWHHFLLTEAGAAGILMGLVFVGVSINLEKILSDPGSSLTGRAAEALILLVAVLTASSLLLVPGQGRWPVGAEVLAVGTAAWAWVLAIQALRLRSWRAIGLNLRRAFMLRVALGQVATLPFVVAGIAVLAWGTRPLLSGRWHGLLNARGAVRRVGAPRRDRLLGRGPGPVLAAPPAAKICRSGDAKPSRTPHSKGVLSYGAAPHLPLHPSHRGRGPLPLAPGRFVAVCPRPEISHPADARHPVGGYSSRGPTGKGAGARHGTTENRTDPLELQTPRPHAGDRDRRRGTSRPLPSV